MVCTRLDIAHAVGVVSRYMSHPRIQHWNAIKWILKYLRGTTNKCLHFRVSTTTLKEYVDLDLVVCICSWWGNSDLGFSITKS